MAQNGAVKRSHSGKSGDEARVSKMNSTGGSSHASRTYLDTVQRTVLDFDADIICSVTLSAHNVYCCLVCGKYFQGKSSQSPAYLHSVDVDHHVFLNMHNERIFVLPDGYEVVEESLGDIRLALHPRFTRAAALQLDSINNVAFAYGGKRTYLPGFLGLNNLGKTDYFNVLILALAHVRPFRNIALLDSEGRMEKSSGTSTGGSKTVRDLVKKGILRDFKSRSLLVREFEDLTCKIWSRNSLKTHVSPHRLVQEIYSSSNKKFKLDTQNDPSKLVIWLLNNIHMGFVTKPSRSIGSPVHESFRGSLMIESKKRTDADSPENETVEKKSTPFMVLSLDLPITPLLAERDSDDVDGNGEDEDESTGEEISKSNGSTIPQISLEKLLDMKFGETSEHINPDDNSLCKFKILKLPRYLIIHIKRFTSNTFNQEKIKTVVTFPLTNLNMANCVHNEDGSKMTTFSNITTSYNLVANIAHDGGSPKDGSYKIQLEDKSKGQWIQIQDLFIEEVASQMLFLSDSYIQIWERDDVKSTFFA